MLCRLPRGLTQWVRLFKDPELKLGHDVLSVFSWRLSPDENSPTEFLAWPIDKGTG